MTAISQPAPRPRRNWRRGFFRLWLVASILWGLFISASFQPWLLHDRAQAAEANTSAEGAPDLVRIKQNVRRLSKAAIPIPDIDAYIASEGVTVDDVRNYQLTPWEERSATGKPISADTGKARLASDRSERDLFGFYFTLIMPPLLVLVCGSIIGWIVRGFRGNAVA